MMNPALKSVLIVDDDASHRLLSRRALRGFTCVEADSAAAAERILTGSEAPALIILDMNLEGQSGIVLLERIRKSHSKETLPIIVLSTSGLDGDVSAAYAAGANTYLVKSTDAAEFNSALQKAVRFLIG